jgi:hypothetical protein
MLSINYSVGYVDSYIIRSELRNYVLTPTPCYMNTTADKSITKCSYISDNISCGGKYYLTKNIM